MKPTTKIYTIEVGEPNALEDNFCLKADSDNPDSYLLCDQYDHEKPLRLPWMKKDELVGWFISAAEALKKAELE
jgi:hypothetical protein